MLYKYKSIEPFRYFVDIIANQRLYAAPYLDLNDPMEGQYLFNASSSINEDIKQTLKGSKQKLKICSLTRDHNDYLMWSHYADGHRGAVFCVDIDKKKYNVQPVEYDGLMELTNRNFGRNSAVEILTHKLESWEYEKEERVFVKSGNYVDVNLRKIIFGSRMDTRVQGLIKQLVGALCPNVELEQSQLNYA